MVLLSCAVACMYKPYKEPSDLLKISERVTFIFFIVEMLIKMVALGLFGHRQSYLSNNWNKFDFLINSVHVVDYLLAFCGINWQISKPLEPLRLIGRIPSMRGLMKVLLDMAPMILNVFFLYVFIIIVFAIVGVQLWAGQLRNRCFLGEDIIGKYNVSISPYYKPKDKYVFICSPDGLHGARRCSNVPPYMQNGKVCSLAAPDHALAANHSLLTAGGVSADACVNWHMYYNVCRPGIHNPQRGAINFDNIGYAWLTTFQVVMLEGWTEIMFYVMDAYCFWSFIFFIPVTIMGSFIMMNVCAVVIVNQFSKSTQRDKGKPPAAAASIAWLCDKLASCLRVISSKYNSRRRSAEHPSDSGSMESSFMVHIWMPVKRRLECIVNSTLFNEVIVFAILFSVVTLAVEHHGQPKAFTRILQVTNLVFVIIFIVEVAMKLLVLSGAYFWDPNNVFDFFIVISSVWELIAKADSRLSILRAFRLLRFVRLVKSHPHLKRQLLVLKRTIEEAVVLCGLLLVGMLVFSLLGMQLFGNKFNFQTKDGVTFTDRKNFDTILWSMVTVFQILTPDHWNLVLYNGMAATSPWAALYFVGLILFGKNIILNILMGIVVESFQERRSSSALSSCADLTHLTPSGEGDNEENHAISGDCSPSGLRPSRSTEINTEEETDTNERSLSLIQRVLRWCKEHEDWSLYILSPQNRLRVCCQRVMSHTMFDHVVLCFILLNCITIAMERPGIAPKSVERQIIDTSCYVFSTIFMIEMFIKVLALGLVFGKESYCHSPWNTMDGLLVVLSLVHALVSLASSGMKKKLGILKVLRLLRALRPLRVIKRAPKLKLAVEALIASVKPIGNIVLICCTFFLFYGILGVQLFKGKFFYCAGKDTRNITSRSECLSANYQWVRKTYNFDNLPQGLLTLFVMFSKDNWVSIMHDGLDAVGVNKQPVQNYNEWMLLFFISFMAISFVLLDMFIGVMVETFYQCQQKQKIQNRLLQEEEAAMRGGEMQVQEPERPYYTHYSPMRRSIYDLCVSDFLDYFMTAIVFISVLMMAFEHYNEPEYIERFVEYSYYVFTAILVMEVLLKLVGFGVLRFFTIGWNLLDIVVALISVISIVLEKTFLKVLPFNPSILRVCRVLRLAQVLKAKKIRLLLKTIIKTIAQVENIILLFAFFFFIYAVLGVELFGRLSCSDDNPCYGLHRHANFKHFGMALLTLFQVCTGDNWSGIMKDTLRSCRPGDSGCLSYLHWVSPICFTSFVVMGQFVLANLVVAAIMQALEDSNELQSKTIYLPSQEGHDACLQDGEVDEEEENWFEATSSLK
ncbi:voltage-dependent T-type calcium channel subunit alpha-1I isoform X2 [Larimichthys crocea]|uniref:voltage-dependent T-type calcium channel subunit alpha-1I isoform X2 n=1 Tax=Larimichthys crocea TaxID=215358 RepID=UPI000F5DD1BF|nr:voltage-dependent T-type calcium channel subunit alpha-1I isoform X2 [Larimichthys crocea]